ARRRVRGATAPVADVAQQREVVDAFLAASRDGDFARLVALLSPDVVLSADELAVQTAAANQSHGAPILAPEVRGAPAVAEAFKGRARHASAALIDGSAGAVWATQGQLRAAILFTIEQGKVTRLEIVMEPALLSELEVNL